MVIKIRSHFACFLAICMMFTDALSYNKMIYKPCACVSVCVCLLVCVCVCARTACVYLLGSWGAGGCHGW